MSALSHVPAHGGLRVIVASRHAAGEWVPAPGTICISLASVGESVQDLAATFHDVLRITVDDVEEPEAGARHWTTRDAERVRDFLARHPDAETLLVHCALGVSRSAGLALGIVSTIGERAGWTPEDVAALEVFLPYHNVHIRRVTERVLRRGMMGDEHAAHRGLGR